MDLEFTKEMMCLEKVDDDSQVTTKYGIDNFGQRVHFRMEQDIGNLSKQVWILSNSWCILKSEMDLGLFFGMTFGVRSSSYDSSSSSIQDGSFRRYNGLRSDILEWGATMELVSLKKS